MNLISIKDRCNSIYKIINGFFICLVTSVHKKNRNRKIDKIMIKSYLKKENKIKSITKIRFDCTAEYLWNAAIEVDDTVFGIPSGAKSVLVYDVMSKSKKYIGNLGEQNKKWTGGGEYNQFVYGFPRTANKLLRIDCRTFKVDEIDINLRYKHEHHYGGVIYKSLLIQPPRDTNHILVINLAHLTVKKIYLSRLPIKFRYCGSFLHPNGMIYFFPEKDEKVIEYDPEKETFRYIGDFIDAMTFSVCLGPLGQMIGFSAYSKGMLMVDPVNSTSKMIHEEIGCTGCYKNILYTNGHIYGLPGRKAGLWDYDVLNDKVSQIYSEEEFIDEPKVASGCITSDGIIGLPAKSDIGYVIEFDNDDVIRKQGGVDRLLYQDFY